MSLIPTCLICGTPLNKTDPHQVIKYCSRGKYPRPGSGQPESCRRMRTILTPEARNKVQ